MNRLGLALAACTMLPLPAFAIGDGWEEINDEDGVKVYAKEYADSPLVGFRGITVMDAPIEKILFVLATNEGREDWVDRLYVSTVLHQESPVEYTMYQAFALPAILSNRDYVYHAKAVRRGEDIVVLEMSSVEHPDAPETVGVRANLIKSRYVMTRLSPKRTRVDVQIQTDPRGMIPTWLVNLIQKSWPMKTLSGLRTQVAKPFIKAYPMPEDPNAVAVLPKAAAEPVPAGEPAAAPAANIDEAEAGKSGAAEPTVAPTAPPGG